MYDNLENSGHDELVTQYAPLVKRIAYHLKARLPATVIVDDLLQIKGGRGYETADSLRSRGDRPDPVERMMRDAKITQIYEGTNQVLRDLIGKHLVK